MDTVITYRGRRVTGEDVAFIRELIASEPGASRRALSRALCEAWGWVQPNGTLRDAVCRGMMLELHRGGHIQLPGPRWVARRPATRRPPTAVEVDRTPIEAPLSALGSLSFHQVRRSDREALVDSLIETHHPLGYTRPVGEHLKFLVTAAGERPVAAFVWSSAPRHLAPRDRFIGWAPSTRRRNLRFVAYNSRFLVLPWVRVPHLASHLLGRMTRMLAAEWERVYAHPVWFAETFVDPTRHRGTCYRAANWVWLGRTTGRGKDDQTGRPNRSLKDVLGRPLHRRFRELLEQTR
jgi:hypothetical protein